MLISDFCRKNHVNTLITLKFLALLVLETSTATYNLIFSDNLR